MPAVRKFTNEQWEYLKSLIPDYLEHRARQTKKGFHTNLQTEWARRFPEIEQLKVSNPTIFAPNARVPSNDPTQENMEDTSGLPPFVWTQEVEQLYNEAIQSRNKQLVNWFTNHTKDAVSKGAASESTHMDGMRMTLEDAVHRKRAPQVIEVYQRVFKDKIRAAIDADTRERPLPPGYESAAATPMPALQAWRQAARRSVIISMWARESAENINLVKEQHNRKRDEFAVKQAALKIAEAEAYGLERDRDRRARFIEGLISRLQGLCKEIQRLCGWSTFMVVGGPNPLLNEKLIIHTISGAYKDAAAPFPDTYKHYKEHVGDPATRWMRDIYRDHRPTEEGTSLPASQQNTPTPVRSHTENGVQMTGGPQTLAQARNASNNWLDDDFDTWDKSVLGAEEFSGIIPHGDEPFRQGWEDLFMGGQDAPSQHQVPVASGSRLPTEGISTPLTPRTRINQDATDFHISPIRPPPGSTYGEGMLTQLAEISSSIREFGTWNNEPQSVARVSSTSLSNGPPSPHVQLSSPAPPPSLGLPFPPGPPPDGPSSALPPSLARILSSAPPSSSATSLSSPSKLSSLPPSLAQLESPALPVTSRLPLSLARILSPAPSSSFALSPPSAPPLFQVALASALSTPLPSSPAPPSSSALPLLPPAGPVETNTPRAESGLAAVAASAVSSEEPSTVTTSPTTPVVYQRHPVITNFGGAFQRGKVSTAAVKRAEDASAAASNSVQFAQTETGQSETGDDAQIQESGGNRGQRRKKGRGGGQGRGRGRAKGSSAVLPTDEQAGETLTESEPVESPQPRPKPRPRTRSSVTTQTGEHDAQAGGAAIHSDEAAQSRFMLYTDSNDPNAVVAPGRAARAHVRAMDAQLAQKESRAKRKRKASPDPLRNPDGNHRLHVYCPPKGSELNPTSVEAALAEMEGRRYSTRKRTKKAAGWEWNEKK